jgi:hypothetical protein
MKPLVRGGLVSAFRPAQRQGGLGDLAYDSLAGLTLSQPRSARNHAKRHLLVVAVPAPVQCGSRAVPKVSRQAVMRRSVPESVAMMMP